MLKLVMKLKKDLSLKDKLEAKQLSNIEKYNNIIKFANDLLEREMSNKGKEHPIFDFIRILGRGLQSDYMKYVFFYNCKGGDHRVPNLDWDAVGFKLSTNIIDENDNLISIRNLFKEINSDKKVNLSKDLVLPWPWHRDRLLTTIKNIGQGRKWGVWEQDFNNHYVNVWLPMGIAWVHGGNHSITMGVVQGGDLKPDYYYDISEVYKHVKCDGKNYMRVKTNAIIHKKIIAPVTNVEFAAIFEIGRLLKEKGLSYID